MINILTGKKIDSTFINTKKGYEFQINRPSFKSGEVYEQNKTATFDNMETRTGLGNRVLRRVNFIKPEIESRKMGLGTSTVIRTKTLDEMINDNNRIKYEEPDPWDTQWLDAKAVIVKRMRAAATPATEEEIELYIAKYPPLNRSQRTRPVTANPLQDANKTISKQLESIGSAMVKVSNKVKKNTANANIIATNQMDKADALEVWTKEQMSQVRAITTQSNLSSDNGQNILGAKLEEVIRQLTFQKGISNQLLMASVSKMTSVDTDKITQINIEAFLDPQIQLAVMKLYSEYYPGRQIQEILFSYERQDSTVIKTTMQKIWDEMKKNNNIYLVNNKATMPPSISFKYDASIASAPITADQQSRITGTDFSSIGYQPSAYVEPTVKLPEQQKLDTRLEIKEDETEREQIIDKINLELQTSLKYLAETSYNNEYTKLTDPLIDIITQENKRIIRINVNYRLAMNENKDLIQYNPDFLKEELYTGKTQDIINYKQKDLFDYTYKKGDIYTYFVWYITLGDVNDVDNWRIVQQLINTTLIEDNVIAYKKQFDYDTELKNIAEAKAIQDAKDAKAIQDAKDAKAIQDKQDAKDAALTAQIAKNVRIRDKAKAEQDKKERIEKDRIAKKERIEKDRIAKAEKDEKDRLAKAERERNETIAKELKTRNEKLNEHKKQVNEIDELNKELKRNAEKIEFGIQDLYYAITDVFDKCKNAKGKTLKDSENIRINGQDINRIFNPSTGDQGKLIIPVPELKRNYNEYKDNVTTIVTKINKDLISVNVGIDKYNATGVKRKLANIDPIKIDYINEKLQSINDNLIATAENKTKIKNLKFSNAEIMKKYNVTDDIAGSGIRSFHKINSIPMIYKKKMNGEGLKLAGKGLKLAGKGKGKPNPWLLHVKKFKESHPDLKYSEVLKQAKLTYTKK
jgi:hypothetical protein